MHKRSILFVLLLHTMHTLFAQEKVPGISDIAQPNAKGRQQVDQWTSRAWYFVEKAEARKKDLDSAFALAQKAITLSKSLHYVKGFNEAMYAAGKAKMEGGETAFAYQSMALLEDTTKAFMLTDLHRYFLDGVFLPKNLDSAVAAVNTALAIARRKKDFTLELKIHQIALGDLLKHGYTARIEEHKNRALLLKDKVSPDDMVFYYYYISNYAYRAHDNTRSLQFALDGIALSESTNKHMIERLYGMLGLAYSGLNQYQKSIEANQKAVDLHLKNRDIRNAWILAEYVIHNMCHLHIEEEAMQYLQMTKTKLGFSRLKDSIIYYRSVAFIHDHAERPDLAHVAWLTVAKLSDKNEAEDLVTYSHLAGYYFDVNKYDSARIYMNRILSSKNMTVQQSLTTHLRLFRMDTTEGNYRSAVQNLLRHRKIQDSIKKNEQKSEMQELLVQYEAQKKDKDLQLQRQSIELLTQRNALKEKDLEQAELNFLHETAIREANLKLAQADAAEKSRNLQIQQASITLLQQDTSLKQGAIDKASFTRDMLMIGSALLVIILFLVLNRYMLKRKNAAQLAERNEKLEQLVHEKELLVKEVHHRVKNNLHTILSLLESQAVFLQDDALAAIQKSQSRIYAMSLIHQKLYKQDNITSVNMEEYFVELLMHLEQSFEENRRVIFRKNIEPIQLDVSQAIPLGLILNEAISNAIKYAFQENELKVIHVSLTQSHSGDICLMVRDNGIGFPENWEKVLHQSLGIKLIRGLSQDIQGDCSIYNDNGAIVTIRFRKTDFMEMPIETKSKENHFTNTLAKTEFA